MQSNQVFLHVSCFFVSCSLWNQSFTHMLSLYIYNIVLSVFGLALLVFSASALGNARMSARQGKDINATASMVINNLSQSILLEINKVLSMPTKAISGLASIIITTLLYPFQLIGKVAEVIGDAGNAAVTSVVDLFVKTTSFPSFVKEVAILSYQSMIGFIWNIGDKSVQWIITLPEVILSQSRIWLSALGISIWNGSKVIGNIISSNVKFLIGATGTKVSNVWSLILFQSRTKIEKFSNFAYVWLSNLVANLVGYFNGGGSSSSTTKG